VGELLSEGLDDLCSATDVSSIVTKGWSDGQGM
jgi:hypothetical protein